MKPTSLMVALSFLLASAIGGFSADTTTAKPKAAAAAKATPAGAPAKAIKAKKKLPKAHKTEEVALTGSYIKRPVRRDGIVTDGMNPVVVLDNDAIRNSGAADLRQLLVLRGVNH